jgi:hypothetical protein
VLDKADTLLPLRRKPVDGGDQTEVLGPAFLINRRKFAQRRLHIEDALSETAMGHPSGLSATPMSRQSSGWQVNSSTWCLCAASNSTRFICASRAASL